MILVFAVAPSSLWWRKLLTTRQRRAFEKRSPLHILWVFSFISAMATDTIVVMEQEGNGFNDIYAKSDSNSTLDEPVASWELPVNQRLLLGWSFGKWVCNANFASSTSASFLSTFLPLPLLIISCILSLYLVWSLWDSHHEKI